MPPNLDSDCNSSTEAVPKVVGGKETQVTVQSTEEWRHSPVDHRAETLHSDDESGNILERNYTGMFEGPEKTLEVVFRRVSDEHIDLR